MEEKYSELIKSLTNSLRLCENIRGLLVRERLL
nr:MAG TPA: hypothetical protein [Caudoviricetes sp.]